MRQKPPHQSFVSLSEQARQEWLSAMADIEPYVQAYAPLNLTPKTIEKSYTSTPHSPPTLPQLHNTVGYSLPALKQGAQDGIHSTLRRSLKRGQLTIDSVLDLHGLSQSAAQEALRSHIATSLRAGQRLMLVITGKGTIEKGGVLRQALPKWLNDEALRPYILAFDTARSEDGGSGAYYVLLRKGKMRS